MTQRPHEKDPQWLSPPELGQDSESHPPLDWLYPTEKGQGSNDRDPGEFSPRDHPPPGYDDAGSGGYAPNDIPARPASAPVPDAGPSTSSAQHDGKHGGLLTSLAAFFGNKGPPPMWTRPAPSHFPYNAFPPMSLLSNNHHLSDGFPELPPPCQMNPHPFATHDVTEEDWKRFLADVKKGSSLSPGQRLKSNLFPTAMGLNLITGFLATSLIEKRMRDHNRGAASDVVDHWNHYFFGPRRMAVVLCQASERLSGGRWGAAPIGPDREEERGRVAWGEDSLSDSSSDGADVGGCRRGHWRGALGRRFDRHARRAARWERRDQRRDEKRARRAERRERKDGAWEDNRGLYQLVVTTV